MFLFTSIGTLELKTIERKLKPRESNYYEFKYRFYIHSWIINSFSRTDQNEQQFVKGKEVLIIIQLECIHMHCFTCNR
jgi:hypothetical protein